MIGIQEIGFFVLLAVVVALFGKKLFVKLVRDAKEVKDEFSKPETTENVEEEFDKPKKEDKWAKQ